MLIQTAVPEMHLARCVMNSGRVVTHRMPVGPWKRSMAVSTLLTFWPPAPLARAVLICTSVMSSSSVTSSTSGMMATVAVDVWMRPPESVAGTRCTRCTPARRDTAHCRPPAGQGGARPRPLALNPIPPPAAREGEAPSHASGALASTRNTGGQEQPGARATSARPRPGGCGGLRPPNEGAVTHHGQYMLQPEGPRTAGQAHCGKGARQGGRRGLRTGLVLEAAVHAVPLDLERRLLVATTLAVVPVDDRRLPVHDGAVLLVHAQEVARPDARLVAAGARADLKHDVLLVQRVPRQQQHEQFILQLLHARPGVLPALMWPSRLRQHAPLPWGGWLSQRRGWCWTG